MRTFKSCDDSQKLRKEQSKAKNDEIQINRMRHALLNEVIHLHTNYAASGFQPGGDLGWR